MKLRELLSSVLSTEELKIMPASFDTVGDIIIFNDFPEELSKKEKEIAEKIIDNFKSINVVCKKVGKYSGIYRTPTLRIMGGKRRKETIHRENDCRLKLHPEKVYFSSRTATERKRICNLIKPGERVLVMFSGIAPLPCVISRNTDAKEIIGVEINPSAHKYGLDNLKLNKIKNVELINGDVRDILPNLKGKFDRILMPLPKIAEVYLDIAIDKVSKNGMIHLYSFISFEDIPLMETKIKQICKSKGRSCEVKDVIKCGQFSPNEYRMSFDIIVN